jgi:hypothetical protein
VGDVDLLHHYNINGNKTYTDIKLMILKQEVIDKIQLAMLHTKKNGDMNWLDGDDIDVCLAGTFAGDKFITIINRTRSNTTKQ